jgi:hypothetical protein
MFPSPIQSAITCETACPEVFIFSSACAAGFGTWQNDTPKETKGDHRVCKIAAQERSIGKDVQEARATHKV